jgi:hypothetical protein
MFVVAGTPVIESPYAFVITGLPATVTWTIAARIPWCATAPCNSALIFVRADAAEADGGCAATISEHATTSVSTPSRTRFTSLPHFWHAPQLAPG